MIEKIGNFLDWLDEHSDGIFVLAVSLVGILGILAIILITISKAI